MAGDWHVHPGKDGKPQIAHKASDCPEKKDEKVLGNSPYMWPLLIGALLAITGLWALAMWIMVSVFG